MVKDFLHHTEEQDISFPNGEMVIHLSIMKNILI